MLDVNVIALNLCTQLAVKSMIKVKAVTKITVVNYGTSNICVAEAMTCFTFLIKAINPYSPPSPGDTHYSVTLGWSVSFYGYAESRGVLTHRFPI
jgi:hypothetical protein